MKTGRRCKLLGNPNPAKTFVPGGKGDKLDSRGIAVSDHIMEYHCPGSMSPDGRKLWYHIYKRTRTGSDTFRYERSFLHELDNRDPVQDSTGILDRFM